MPDSILQELGDDLLLQNGSLLLLESSASEVVGEDGPVVRGVGTRFLLDSSGGVLTDISTYLYGIESTSDTELIDGTCFPVTPVPTASKYMVPGFVTKTYVLNVMWTAAAETFFTAIEARRGLRYEYGPGGSASGAMKIHGVCDAARWTGPVASIGSVTIASIALMKRTEVRGTFV